MLQEKYGKTALTYPRYRHLNKTLHKYKIKCLHIIFLQQEKQDYNIVALPILCSRYFWTKDMSSSVQFSIYMYISNNKIIN